MARVPYEMVTIEADKLLDKVFSAKDTVEMYELYGHYLDYLRACGWSEEEYDRETLRRVNLGWEEKQPPIPKSQVN